MLNKLKSRKFLMSLAGDLIGVITLVAAEDGNDVQVIASIILIIVSTVAYIMGEAKVDAASAATTIGESTAEIIKLIKVLLNNDDPLIDKAETALVEEVKDTENNKTE